MTALEEFKRLTSGEKLNYIILTFTFSTLPDFEQNTLFFKSSHVYYLIYSVILFDNIIMS